MTTTHTIPVRIILGLGQLLYGIYAWTVFVCMVFMATLFSIITPGLQRRRHWVSAPGRWFFALTGVRTTVHGLEKLPPGNCIVVANHASYLDGIILQCFLPPRFSYVIKGEVQNVPVLHFVLRRMGSKFVERFKAAGSTRDARALVKAAATGESLAFFPEGTFIRDPGLGRFRPGAFAAAIKGGLPVVPVVIRGSRKILPARQLLPRCGPLQIDVCDPIETADEQYTRSAVLADAARFAILQILDEPDLVKTRPA